ncbi:hypothetical protein SCLARK_001665 [Spiroplasma clarkii]|uniref:hypothetical protein n=1 Tax=Spiroplasma clarkii TaxID=2139 RepID=UPI000B563ECA|nr:hypothetical protein [Spiroplasma clarkii]ARU92133.1 hypothetical protein SCLARK_001665 [Spiroplasma clarkii]
MNQDGSKLSFNNPDRNGAKGYLAGLHKDLSLASDYDRRQLAWGIQDTGALTNYLLNKGFDGGYPGDTRARMDQGTLFQNVGPGTWDYDSNGGGYAWYNSLMYTGKSAINFNFEDKDNQWNNSGWDANRKLGKSNLELAPGYTNDKPGNEKWSTLKDGDQKIEFNEVGGRMAQAGQSNNFGAGVSFYGSLLQNLSTTSSGAMFTGELANYLMPIVVSDVPNDRFLQGISFSLITNVWHAFNYIVQPNYLGEMREHFTDDLLDKIKELPKAPDPLGTVSQLGADTVKPSHIGFDVLRKYQGNSEEITNPITGKPSIELILDDKESTNAKLMVEIVGQMIAEIKAKTGAERKAATALFTTTGSFGRPASGLLSLFENAGDAWNDQVLSKMVREH